MNLDYTITPNITLQSASEYFSFGGQQSNKNYVFQDLNITYNVKKPNLLFGLKRRNLLDKSSFSQMLTNEFGFFPNRI